VLTGHQARTILDHHRRSVINQTRRADSQEHPRCRPSARRHTYPVTDQVLREDAAATNRQQVGYRSVQIPAGRLMLNSEHNLQAFMRRTYQALIT
jgi:hypothetical protein